MNVQYRELLQTVDYVIYVGNGLLHGFHFRAYFSIMWTPGIHHSSCSTSLLDISMARA